MGALIEIDHCCECGELKVLQKQKGSGISYRWYCKKANEIIIKRLTLYTKYPTVPKWCPKIPKGKNHSLTTRELAVKSILSFDRYDFSRVICLLNHNLRLLEAEIPRLKRFIKSAEKDLNSKRLDKESFYAEIAAARIAIGLNDSLQKMTKLAIMKADRYCFAFLNPASAILAYRIDRIIKYQRIYPKDYKMFRKNIIADKINASIALFTIIKKELGDVPERLGFELPDKFLMTGNLSRVFNEKYSNKF